MAKNKGLKWVVGLSSVAVFTGFVGLSQKYDHTNVATSNSSQANENGGSYYPNSSNDRSHTWNDTGDDSQSWSDSNNGSQFGSSFDNGGLQDSGGFGNNGTENNDNNQIKGHAS